MFNKLRNALISAVGSNDGLDYVENHKTSNNYKYVYSRPSFLKFSEEEVSAASDTRVRPLILPRDVEFPFKAGYCECINAGKSKHNEDQAAFWRRTLKPKWLLKRAEVSEQSVEAKEAKEAKPTCAIPSHPYDINQGGFTDLTFEGNGSDGANGDLFDPEAYTLTYTAFGIFDGHGGPMVAVAAARELQDVLHAKLDEVAALLLPDPDAEGEADGQQLRLRGGLKYQIEFRKPLSSTQLVVGALESAFKEMDRRVSEDKDVYRVRGGCTAILTLFILGRVYTACAGDSRAIVAVGNSVEPLSRDHTPTSERSRICHVGFQKPFLLKDDFTPNEYVKRPTVHDLGKRVLYRDPEGYGYSYRTVETEDLKMPLVSGCGKRARLLGTIGVTRGFGDHELKALGSPYSIKPFLSAVPEIRILNVLQVELTAADVVIMGSDGLFDVTTNAQAANVVRNSFNKMSNSDDRKYMCAAQDLVNYARGKPATLRSWKKNDGDPASGDDITAWVIPLLPYQLEHNQWYLNLPAQSRDGDIVPYNVFKFRDECDKLPITCVDDSLLSDNEDTDSILSFS